MRYMFFLIGVLFVVACSEPEPVIPTLCELEGFLCKDLGMVDGELVFFLESEQSYPLEINRVDIDGCTYEDDDDVVSPEESFRLRVTCEQTSGVIEGGLRIFYVMDKEDVECVGRFRVKV